MDKRQGLVSKSRSRYDDKFRIKNDKDPARPGDLHRSLIDNIIEKVRGFSPTPITVFDPTPGQLSTEEIKLDTDSYLNPDQLEAVGHDYAMYRRSFNYRDDDATNVVMSNIGWNDPSHISALVLDPKYPEQATQMIPLELVLRTPIESWNPENITKQTRATVTGKGTQADPYSGYADEFYFYHTPSSVYQGVKAPGLKADTGKTKWVNVPGKSASEYESSGIHIFLSGFKTGEEYMRTRFPIAMDAMETGLVGHFIDRALEEAQMSSGGDTPVDMTLAAQGVPSKAECITAFKRLDGFDKDTSWAKARTFRILDTIASSGTTEMVTVSYVPTSNSVGQSTAGNFYHEHANIAK